MSDDKPVLVLTPAAWDAVWAALEEGDGAGLTYRPSDFTDHYLRVGIKGGGCGGFTYDMDLERGQPPAGWLVWHQEDSRFIKGDFDAQPPVRIAVDPISAQYLRGATVDFQRTGIQQGFTFANPNARSTCGCQRSFTT